MSEKMGIDPQLYVEVTLSQGRMMRRWTMSEDQLEELAAALGRDGKEDERSPDPGY